MSEKTREWYEEQDFDANPLEQETRLIGNEELTEEIGYGLDAGNILVLEGEEGLGKTRLLKEMSILKDAALIDCREVPEEDIIEVFRKKKGFILSLFSKSELPKNVSLLLDNAESLSRQNLERLKYLYDHNFVKALVLAVRDKNGFAPSEGMEQRISRVLKMGHLSDYEAVQLFREKIGYELLPDKVVKEAYKLSDKNIKKFLANCERLLKLKRKDIQPEEVAKLLKEGGA